MLPSNYKKRVSHYLHVFLVALIETVAAVNLFGDMTICIPNTIMKVEEKLMNIF